MQKLLIKLLAIAAVVYPLWVHIQGIQWSWDSSLLLSLFPIFGLAAASMLWLHAISGVFEPWLRRNFDFDQFVRITASLIFISFILHPLLLILSPAVTFGDLLFRGGDDIWLGMIAFVLLLTYDVGKALKRRNFFSRHWTKILILSNVGFLITFIHSLELGSDLQIGLLRYIWMFYGVTALLAIIYTYAIKKPTT